ncbi:MAG: L-ribulose-5-phosphate 4-epimerase [Pelolinea sp.]|nr:L-ribulose-5-phosphate 4-epimerase [Pelolinea sp.]
MLENLKIRVSRLLAKLPENHLVCSTGGNVSARDPESGYMVIKPSGVPYEDLSPEALVVVDAQGNRVEGKFKPSSDTASHLYIYQKMPEINGIVHTHSPYATAFAVAERPIPVVFSETAEEFGGEIPLSEFVLVGGEAIGEQVVKYGSKIKAVVLRKHGIFTIGSTPEKAVDLAILAENSAFVAWLSFHLNPAAPLSEKDIQALYYRQQNIYGQ